VKIKKIISIILLSIILFTGISKLNIVNASTQKLKIVLDPGHGGSMPGAVNHTKGLIESECTLKLANYLKAYLEQYDNVEVVMTHNGNLPSNYELEISERGMIARRNNANLFVSLHFNSSTSNNVNGAEVYVSASKVLPKYYEETSKLGNKILNNLSNLGIYNRGVQTRLCQDIGPKWEYSDGTKADYYGVIRYAMKGDSEDRGVDITKGEGVPSILIEHCFINGSDTQFMDSDSDLKNLAIADGKAIVEHYGLKLKSEVVQNIFINKSNASIQIGETIQLVATVEPNTAKNKNVKWSTSNSKIAKVDETGKVTALSTGKVIITATSEDKNLKATTTIKVEEANFSLNTNKISALVGDKIKLLPNILTNNTNTEITWKSNDEKIAKVDQNGIITAIAKGTTIITATLDTNKCKAEVQIDVNELKEASIKINKYIEENGFITKIGDKVKKADFLKNIVVTDNLKVELSNTYIDSNKEEFITTDTRVKIIERNTNKLLKEYTVIKYGDVNKDGRITPADSTLVLRQYVGLENLLGTLKLAMDVNGDGRVTPADSTVILRTYVGLTSINR